MQIKMRFNFTPIKLAQIKTQNCHTQDRHGHTHGAHASLVAVCKRRAVPLESKLILCIKSHEEAHTLWCSHPTPGILSKGNCQKEGCLLTEDKSVPYAHFRNRSWDTHSDPFHLRAGGKHSVRNLGTRAGRDWTGNRNLGGMCAP